MVQAVHDLFDAGGVIPPVDVEDVNIIRAELLERRFDGNVQRFGVVANVLRLLLKLGGARTLEIRRVLCDVGA